MGVTELQEIREAIAFTRTYARRYTVQLVFSGRATFDQALAKLHQPLSDMATKSAAEELVVALVTFLMMWRLFLDQSRHDLSERFGDQSLNFTKFIDATRTAYDNHPGYRLVEGLRNYVQHVGMPDLDISTNSRQGNSGELPIVVEASVVLRREGLLEYLRKYGGQRILRQDLEQQSSPLPVIELLDDAMRAFEELVRFLIDIDSPDLISHLERIKALADEAAPGAAWLVDLGGVTQAGGSIGMIRFEDLYEFFPILDLPGASNPESDLGFSLSSVL